MFLYLELEAARNGFASFRDFIEHTMPGYTVTDERPARSPLDGGTTTSGGRGKQYTRRNAPSSSSPWGRGSGGAQTPQSHA